MKEKLLSHHTSVLNSVGGGDQEDVSKENHKRLLRKRKRNTMSELKTLGGGKENKFLKGLTNEGKRFLDEQAKRIKTRRKQISESHGNSVTVRYVN
jgi:ribosomal protein S19E (S16A)